MALALYGAADVVLTGSPQVTFFRHVWRRAAPFALESIENAFAGQPADFGRKASCQISRQGDAVTHVWLQVTLPNLDEALVNNPQAATALQPFIVSARRTSRTSARVRIRHPAADTSYQQYRVTFSPTGSTGGGEVTVTTSPSDPLVAAASGLEDAGTYDVVATGLKDGGSGEGGSDSEPSPAAPLIALKYTNGIGWAMCRMATLEIGGVTIDRYHTEWLDVWNEVALKDEKRHALTEMVGLYPEFDMYDDSKSTSGGGGTLYVPIPFYFSKAIGLALPLIALSFHDVRIQLEFRELNYLVKSDVPISSLIDVSSNKPPSCDCRMFAQYAYMDVEERRKFSSLPSEYLLEQTQEQEVPVARADGPTFKISLPFSHPVKEIFFHYLDYESSYEGDAVNGNDYFNYGLPGGAAGDPFDTVLLQINGHPRQSERPASFYRLMVPFQCHTRVPRKKVYNFSFSLDPESTQPSGSTNFSRVDSAHLVVKLNPAIDRGRVRVYAVNYNVARVASGLLGLAFTG